MGTKVGAGRKGDGTGVNNMRNYRINTQNHDGPLHWIHTAETSHGEEEETTTTRNIGKHTNTNELNSKQSGLSFVETRRKNKDLTFPSRIGGGITERNKDRPERNNERSMATTTPKDDSSYEIVFYAVEIKRLGAVYFAVDGEGHKSYAFLNFGLLEKRICQRKRNAKVMKMVLKLKHFPDTLFCERDNYPRNYHIYKNQYFILDSSDGLI